MRRKAAIDETEGVTEAAKARDAVNAERAKAIGDLGRETAAEAQQAKGNLGEAEHGFAAAKAEAATLGQQASERRDVLEQDIARLTAEHEAEKRELERKVQAERAAAEGFRESFQTLRAEHRTSYKAALEGPAHQITALEGAISDIQRSSGAELNGLRQRSEKVGQRTEELEVELARVQAKLAQTEQEVQDGTSRVNLAKANHRASREALEREKEKKSEDLLQVQRSTAQKSEQLKAMTRSGEDVRKRMLREIEEVKAAKAKQLAEADHRMHALRSEYSMALEDKELEHKSGVSGNRDRLDGLVRENEQLRRYVSEHRYASGHVQDVGGQVQRSLASMEDRAADLRRELRR